jgi:hypothetical protein
MKNYILSFNRRNIYNFCRKTLVLTSIILFSNTIHSTPKIDKKKQLNLPFPTDEIPEESEKVKKLQEELDFIRKEFSSFKEDTLKKLEDLSNKTQDRVVVKEPVSGTKSLSPVKSTTPTGESMTNLTKPVKNYGIQSKGLKLKNLDENNGGKRHAIVVGINNYQDTGISDLSKARNDAKLVGKILREQGEFEQVVVMTDDIDPRNDKENLYPTKLNIEEKLDSLLRFSEPDDLVVFFFSGHGISDPDENGYLVTVDTVTDKQFNTSLKVNDVILRLKAKGIKKSLLVLDACRDVLYSSKSSSRNSLLEKEYTEAEVAATFYSTKAGYYSYEDDETDYGVFTKYLVMGMEGKADSNGDGVVAFSELEQYVQKGVKDWSTKKNKQQKPFTRLHGEKTGDLAITFSKSDTVSLVDKPIPKVITRGDVVFRSAFLPGWGQYYAGEETKGMLFMGGSGVLLTYYFLSMQQHQALQEKYDSSYSLPGTPAFAATYYNLQTLKAEIKESELLTNNALFVLLGVYTWNLIDSGVKTEIPKNDFFTFGITPSPVPQSMGTTSGKTMETYGFLNYTYRF